MGDSELAGLAVVRSLGRAGNEVHLVSFDPRSATRFSRYVSRRYDFGHPLENLRHFGSALLELVASLEFDLVVPVTEAAQLGLDSVRESLEGYTRLALPNRSGLTATHDKGVTMQLALELGIPIPATRTVASPDEIAEALGSDTFPVVLKPSRSTTPNRVAKNLVRIADTDADIEDRLPGMLKHGPVLVQEFCPGFGLGLSVVAVDGEVFAGFQHRRLHEPPRGGASSYRCSMPVEAELLGHAQRMCRRLRWTGPAMFEFKRDPESGRTVLMEINGRFWGSLALAVGAGVDFPRLLYEALVLGHAPATFVYRVPFFARHTTQEIFWLRANVRAPSGRRDVQKVGARELCGEVRNLLRGQETLDTESWSDPVPGAVSWCRLIGSICGSLVDRVGNRWAARRFEVRGRRMRRRLRRRPGCLAGINSVLVLCHGNINRSAFAAEQLRAQFEAAALPIVVRSAGFVPEDGRRSGSRSRAVAATLGVDLEAHRSRGVTRADLSRSDLILLMDASNARDLKSRDRGAVARTLPLGAFAPDKGPIAIPDPYGGDTARFESIYRRIAVCINAATRYLRDAGGTQ